MDFQKEKRKEPNNRDIAHITENKKIKKTLIGDVSKDNVEFKKEMKRQYNKDYRARQKEKKLMQERPNGDENIQTVTPTPNTISSVMTQAYTFPSERLPLQIMSNRQTHFYYYANQSGPSEMTSPSTIPTTSSVINFANKENITPLQTQPLHQMNSNDTGDSSTNALLKRKIRNKAYYERKKEEKRLASQNQQPSNNGQAGILLPLFEQEVGVTATSLECRVRNSVNSSIHDDTLQLDPYDYVFDGVPNKTRVLKKQKPCVHCGAKRFQFEFPTFCCMSGKTKLANSIIPSELHHLFTSQCELGKHFRHSIRSYNTSFSFASMGVKLDTHMASMTSGVYTFRVCGGIYHSLDQLVPRDGQPRYLQLYFYDEQSEFSHRMVWPNLDKNVVQIIRRVLATNPYVATFRSLADLGPLDNYRVTLNASVELDQRVYNRPTTSEVAGIWVEGNDNITSYERSIVVYGKSQYSQKIQPHYGCYDPLCYPLLFPNGDPGWHPKIPRHGVSINDITDVDDNNNDDVEETTTRRGRKTVTMREYYCYKLQIRPTDNLLLLGGRLLQQFVVDQYIKIETSRLLFCERNQAQIRADLYQGIVDCVNAGEVQSNRVGQRVVLPASFIGGPRDMRRRFLDAMALVQIAGKPDIFLTMTCNPKWDEILDELLPGQTAQDRPELVARAFRAKLEDLKDQLLNKHILGEVASYVYVIEFQKRGLPHAHFLLIMTPQHKMSNPDHYDKIVCAEIPNPTKHPKMHEYVLSHMMHGPCGHLRTSSPCMQGEPKRCRFNYPKEFNDKTTQGEDSYPLYRRRDNGIKVDVRGKTLDNRWVAPYNPKLLMMFNCHINIEVCSSIKSVKYVFKYVYKGHDKQVVHIDPDGEDVVINEIKKFQDARYVSPPEAMWRLFNFPLSKIHPYVMALHLHLPNKQMVRFRDDDVMTDIIARERDKRSMLTAFFEKNRIDVSAKQHLYKDFPKKFTWDVKTRTWNTRKMGSMIGRLVSANPAEGERYYLRLLLTHVSGPTCFEDLYTVNGILYSTFRRAALERGLIESDDNLDACLTEASLFQFPCALRRLFVTILIFCEPGDVRRLWDTHYESFSEDYKRQCQSDERVQNMVLNDISTSLQSLGKHLDDFDLPKLNASINLESGGFREVQEEYSIIVEDEHLLARNSLNADQKAAFDEIIKHVDDDHPGVFFIDGPGGTGKTYLYKALLAEVRSRGLIALATASSGAAANNMSGGRTAHSRFKIPLVLNNNSMCNIKKQSGAAQLLRMAKVIIWDEASMAKRQAVEAVDRTMQDITCVRLPFGGKIMILGGDFRQVLPVVRRGTRAQTVDSSLRMSPLWHLIKKMRLTINMRALSDPWFSDFLLRVGDGAEEVLDETFIRIPDDMVIPYSDNNRSIEDLINAVFPSLHMNETSADYIISRAILSTKNDNVDEINERMIGRFNGEEKIYYSFDEAEDDKNNYYPNEFLNTLNVSGLPPHCLRLKVGCPIILLRNLDPSNGLCNGTRLICRSFQPNVIDAEIAVGQHYGKRVFIHRIPLCPSENDMFPFKLKRKQFPIRLSFAMSINKAQGQTIPNVGVYLPDSVFSHGQLYVALSRGISRDNTKVLVKPVKLFDREGVYTSNVVYREVLRDE